MKRTLLGLTMIVAVLMISACTTSNSRSSDPDTRRASINAGADAALESLFRQADGSKQLVDSAKGVLIFPSVLEAGLIFGASSGEGVLRKNGDSVSYHRTTSGSWGLQLGAQSTAVFILFMTDEALASFEAREGWSVGADASVTLLSVGANANVTSETAQQPVVGYVLSNRGLMAGLTLNGTRITRLNL